MNSKELLLQAFLRQHGLDTLCQRYQIKTNRHSKFPNLVCFKYSQRESPLAEPLVQQCRGIILDEAQDWAIASYPYDKFFNYGEPNAATIDWSSARVYDKLDGSLMTLYFHAGQWRVQSSGTPDASGDVGGFGFSFQTLFWQVWNELGYCLPNAALPEVAAQDYCFCFELMTPYNRVVVRHQENQLVLHGVRNRITHQEADPNLWADRYGWSGVNTVKLNNWNDILATAQTLDPQAAEGYIVCDAAFRRVKVKSPQYVALSHLRDSFTPRRLMEVVVQNEGDEFLTYFPEWREQYERIQATYRELIQAIEADFQSHRDIPSQKDFAGMVRSLPYSGILFALRSGKVPSATAALQALNPKKLEQLLLTA